MSLSKHIVQSAVTDVPIDIVEIILNDASVLGLDINLLLSAAGCKNIDNLKRPRLTSTQFIRLYRAWRQAIGKQVQAARGHKLMSERIFRMLCLVVIHSETLFEAAQVTAEFFGMFDGAYGQHGCAVSENEFSYCFL